MKRVRLIYNPYSGNRMIRHKLDEIIYKFQKEGYEITPYRTTSALDIYKNINTARGYDCIVSCGGDGTLNHVINAMMMNDIDIPIGILPCGTANDFAFHIGIDRSIVKACDVITRGKTSKFDLGIINNRYFVNVAAGGLLTDVSQKIDINMKNTLGKMAYYLKGIEQIPNFRAIPVKISQGDLKIETEIYLFVILNGETTGGFKMAPGASASDGKLDLIAIKACNMGDMINFLLKCLKESTLRMET